MPAYLTHIIRFLVLTAILTPILYVAIPYVVEGELNRQLVQCLSWQQQGYPIACGGAHGTD